VWLPSTTVQQRIAEVLLATHDAIEQSKAVINQTRKMQSALSQALLTGGFPLLEKGDN
jgi:restriction endonuclease S subunit